MTGDIGRRRTVALTAITIKVALEVVHRLRQPIKQRVPDMIGTEDIVERVVGAFYSLVRTSTRILLCMMLMSACRTTGTTVWHVERQVKTEL